MITKKELSETLGLSCVEKYFLAWLDRSYDVTALYGSAFAELARVLDDFASGATYQYYSYLPRLQDVAEEYGIVTHKYIPCSIEAAIETIRETPDEVLCLMRVNTAFFTEFKRSSWREDHYVCINGGMEWINEYPLSTGKFSESRFAEVFDGALCLYSSADTTANVEDMLTSSFVAKNCESVRFPFALEKLESAIGILRVTRKRMERFYRLNEKVAQALNEEIALLDKMYFDVRLRQIKDKRGEKSDKAEARADLCERLKTVIALEKRAAEILKNDRT